MKKDQKKAEQIFSILKKISAKNIRPSFTKRLERVLTDSFFQYLRYRYNAWRFEQLDSEPNVFKKQKYKDRFISAHRAWQYGRPLTKTALTAYKKLQSQGFSVRELRLAVFAGYIQPNGTIKINRKKEIILHLMAFSLVAISVVYWLNITAAILLFSTPLINKILAVTFISALVAIPTYILFFICCAPTKTARKIQAHM